MEKYFSSAVCRKGYCSAYRTIYKSDTGARVFLLADGNDTERAVFFRRLEKNLAGYRVSLFNPFYDGAPDGIHIKNPNIYILSDGGYGKISPALPGGWEQYISIAEKKSYPASLRKEILSYKAAENEAYKKGCEALRRAADIREKLHGEISLRLDDEKLINFIRRFCLRTFRNAEAKGGGTVRLLSSPTPLGIHTHWDTVFNSCETVISVRDEAGFVSSVILGIIKDYAVSEKLPFIISPSYFLGEIPQFLLFPSLSPCSRRRGFLTYSAL